MHIDSRTRVAVTVLTAFAALIAGCGGGGGGEDDEEEEFDNEATGIWNGTQTPDGRTGVSATLVAEPDGRFVVVSGLVYLSGTGSVSGDRLAATATGWAPTGTSFANGSATGTFSLIGTVFEENRIDSSYAGASESGRFVFNYDSARSNRPVSLAVVAGSYTTSGGGALAIDSIGAMTLNSPNGPNCIGNGVIRVPDASRNVYTWSMTLSGCTASNGNASGVAFLDDVNGRANSRIILLGAAIGVPVIVTAEK